MRRNPFLHWLLMIVTLGQYGFLWGFRLARDVNRLSPAAPIPVQKHARAFVIGYIGYFGAMTAISVLVWRVGPIPDLNSAFRPLFFLGVALTVHFIWLLTRIAGQLRSISQSAAPRTSTVVLLSFLWMTSLPYLQSHANKNV
jgi:hypothetical protein